MNRLRMPSQLFWVRPQHLGEVRVATCSAAYRPGLPHPAAARGTLYVPPR